MVNKEASLAAGEEVSHAVLDEDDAVLESGDALVETVADGLFGDLVESVVHDAGGHVLLDLARNGGHGGELGAVVGGHGRQNHHLLRHHFVLVPVTLSLGPVENAVLVLLVDAGGGLDGVLGFGDPAVFVLAHPETGPIDEAVVLVFEVLDVVGVAVLALYLSVVDPLVARPEQLLDHEGLQVGLVLPDQFVLLPVLLEGLQLLFVEEGGGQCFGLQLALHHGHDALLHLALEPALTVGVALGLVLLSVLSPLEVLGVELVHLFVLLVPDLPLLLPALVLPHVEGAFVGVDEFLVTVEFYALVPLLHDGPDDGDDLGTVYFDEHGALAVLLSVVLDGHEHHLLVTPVLPGGVLLGLHLEVDCLDDGVQVDPVVVLVVDGLCEVQGPLIRGVVEVAGGQFLEVKLHFVVDEVDEVLSELPMFGEVDGVDLIESDLLLTLVQWVVTDIRYLAVVELAVVLFFLLYAGLFPLVVVGLEVLVGSGVGRVGLLFLQLLLHFVSLELEGLEVLQFVGGLGHLQILLVADADVLGHGHVLLVSDVLRPAHLLAALLLLECLGLLLSLLAAIPELLQYLPRVVTAYALQQVVPVLVEVGEEELALGMGGVLEVVAVELVDVGGVGVHPESVVMFVYVLVLLGIRAIGE